MAKQFVIFAFIIVASTKLWAIDAMEAATVGQMGTSVVSQAGATQEAAVISSAINVGIGGWLARTSCGQPQKGLDCAMGVMRIGQGALQARSANEANRAGNSAAGYSGLSLSGGSGQGGALPEPTVNGFCESAPALCADGGPGSDGTLTATEIEDWARDLQNTISQRGARLTSDGRGVTLDGKGTFPTDVLGDPSALSNAGFDQQKVSDLFNSISEMSMSLQTKLYSANGLNESASAPRVTGMGFSPGGGAKSRRPANAYKFETNKSDPFADILKRMGQKNRKPTAAGMIRRLPNGDVIGAKGDNIFEMVHRRYRQKARQNMFRKP